MGIDTFPVTVGESFLSALDGVTLKFIGTDEFDIGTMMFAMYVEGENMGGINIRADVFIYAYDLGNVREVPGAGNVREVV